MTCAKCGAYVGDCLCPDIDERLREMGKSPFFMTAYCHNPGCGKHYTRCQCDEPDFKTEVPDVG